jgi:PKD repeat protein
MKIFLLCLSLILAGSSFAQTLQEAFSSHIQLSNNSIAMDGKNLLTKSVTCGPDTLGYAQAKATGLQYLIINGATSAEAVAQYFDAPQPVTISGISFYGFKQDLTNGTTMNVGVEIYTAGIDSIPGASAVLSTSTVIDTAVGTGTLDEIRQDVTFATPITLTEPYLVVISNNTATPMILTFNSWNAGDGDQEWLSSISLGGTWLRSYFANIGGALFNADCLFEPHVTYALEPSFTVDDPCFSNGQTLNFTNTSSPIVDNRMYNVAAFLNVPEISYTWNYGDGSPPENGINATHTYPSAGAYDVILTDTIFGWSTNCSADTLITLNSPPIASFSSTSIGLTIDFASNSINAGAPIYLWDFGDGNTSTQMDPTHVYGAEGTYSVCLIISDGCGTDSTCQNIVVTNCAPPNVGFSFAETGVGTGVFNFTNTSSVSGAATYSWDFGDGNNSSAVNPTHSYTATGIYTVTLVITDSCGTNSFSATVGTIVGINDLTLADVSVYPNPSSGIFTVESSVEMIDICISDVSGKLVYNGSLSGKQGKIDLTEFVDGMYLVSIRFNNDMIQTLRLEVAKE